MGLDNGITISRNKKWDSLISIGDYDYFNEKEFEVAYWRKCYNIREDIFNVLKDHGSGFNEDYTYELDEEMLVDIIKVLKSYNRHTWCYSNSHVYGSIWGWKEIKPTIKRNIRTLRKVLKMKQRFGDELKVEFYDSY